MTFAKGQSGNPGGNGTRKPITDALNLMLKRPVKDNDKPDDLSLPHGATIAHKIARNIIKAALAGDKHSMAEVANRVEGTPKQTTEISGPEGGPIKTKATGDLEDIQKLLEKARAIKG